MKRHFFALNKDGFSSSKIAPNLKISHKYFCSTLYHQHISINAKCFKVKAFFQWIFNGNFSNFEESKQLKYYLIFHFFFRNHFWCHVLTAYKVSCQYRYFKRSQSPENPYCSLDPFFWLLKYYPRLCLLTTFDWNKIFAWNKSTWKTI